MNLSEYLLNTKDLDLGYFNAFGEIYVSSVENGYADRINTTAFLASLVIDHYVEHHSEVHISKYINVIMSIFETENKLLRKIYSDEFIDEYEFNYDGDLVIIYNIVNYAITRLLEIAILDNNNKKLKKLDKFLNTFNDDLSELLSSNNVSNNFIYNSSFTEYYNMLYSPSYYGTALFYISFIVKILAERVYYSLRPEEHASGLQLLNNIYTSTKSSIELADGMFNHTVVQSEVI